MIRRTSTIAALSVCAALLAGCGDAPQTIGESGVKVDEAPYKGVSVSSQFVQPGWKAGDRTSWEQQLKARAAYGQNEYTRVTN